ncbi:hypothetical protein [Schumannella luteola]
MTARSAARRLSALAVGVLALAGAVAAAPLAASAATTSYTLDCETLITTGAGFPVVPGDTVTLEVTGFDSYYDYNSSTSQAVDETGDTLVFASGTDIELYSDSGPCTASFYAYVYDAAPETVPSGSHLFTEDITIPLGAPQVTLTEDVDDEHFLGGDEDCGLSTYVHGIHVYGTLDVTVTTAGTYTFRGMRSTPAGDYVPINAFDPIGDPMLAVYSSFDPANPDAGVVGCNDDLNDIGDENDAEYLSDGTIIEGHQPWFSAALAPGDYTLVLMTWEDLSDENLADGFAPYSELNFAVGAKTTTFELWGPEGGLALGHEVPKLAATGLDATPLVVAGAVALFLGAAALGSARRRRSA